MYSGNYYAIYLRKTDEFLASGTSKECTEQLGLSSVDSFYCLVSRVKRGKNTKYEVLVERWGNDGAVG